MSFGDKIKGLFKKNKSPQTQEQTKTKNMGEHKECNHCNKSKIKSAGSSDNTSKIELDSTTNSHIEVVAGEGQSEDEVTKALDLDELENIK